MKVVVVAEWRRWYPFILYLKIKDFRKNIILPTFSPIMVHPNGAPAPSPPPPPSLGGPPSIAGTPAQNLLRVQWPVATPPPPAADGSGGRREIIYEAEMGTGISPFALVYSGPKTEATLEGLEPGVTYRLRVSLQVSLSYV